MNPKRIGKIIVVVLIIALIFVAVYYYYPNIITPPSDKFEKHLPANQWTNFSIPVKYFGMDYLLNNNVETVIASCNGGVQWVWDLNGPIYKSWYRDCPADFNTLTTLNGDTFYCFYADQDCTLTITSNH